MEIARPEREHHLIIAGRFQSVGYRYSMAEQSARLGVTLEAAISEAKVYRCLDKPWVDEDLVKVVGEALSSSSAS